MGPLSEMASITDLRKRCAAHPQTTNLGVRSSNLFGRASFQHYPCESHGIRTASRWNGFGSPRTHAILTFLSSNPLCPRIRRLRQFHVLARVPASHRHRSYRRRYSAATCAASALRLGLIAQASSQLSTLSDLTNLPTPSTSAQNKPSSMISSSEKCLASSV
jgi:hypothetical protein